MIKKYLKTLLITSVVILLPIAAGIILWDQLPDQIPRHWNFAGEVDGWSSKAFAVFGMPLILAAGQWLGLIATLTDPKKQNHSEKMIHLVLWILPILSTVLHTITYIVALGNSVQIEVLMPIFLGLLFAIIGNYLPKCKQNYTIGIKIPWTLHSEENWNRTHRFAGRIWVAGGLIIMLTGFYGSFVIFFSVTLLIALVPILYSFLLHRKGI